MTYLVVIVTAHARYVVAEHSCPAAAEADRASRRPLAGRCVVLDLDAFRRAEGHTLPPIAQIA